MTDRWFRRTALVLVAAVAAGLITAAEPAGAGPPPVTVHSSYSSIGGAAKFAGGADRQMSSVSGSSSGQVIGVDTAMTYQSMLGLGGSLESSSVYNLTHVSATSRNTIMSALFSQSENNFDIARLPFGCPDFCAQAFYTYDDLPAGQTDPALSSFSIQKDVDAGTISIARQALDLNPNLKFYASPWSPPAWMKDNGSITGGGTVPSRWYQTLANYYTKAIQAYQAQGIPIYAFTPQNEPTVTQNYPSTSWTWQQERDFVIILGRTFASNGLSTKIWIQDDNLLRTSDFGGNILADPTAGPYVAGVAFHDYEGDPGYTGDLTQVDSLRAAHPDTGMQLTERSYYGTAGADRLVQDFRHWMSSWTYWLTFLDDQGQPNAGPLDARGSVLPITAPHGDLDSWSLTDQYYLYGQFSRYIQPGARRVDSDYGSASTVTDVTFVNPDGTVVMVVVNQSANSQPLTVISPDGQFTALAAPAAVTTFWWKTSTGTAINRIGWQVAASAQGQDPAAAAIDFNTLTRYDTRSAQAPGQNLWIDMGSVHTVSRISLDQGEIDNGASSDDWPRGYVVYTSSDGYNWGSPIATGTGTARMTNILFPAVSTRYLRVEQTGSSPDHWWSVSEFFAFTG